MNHEEWILIGLLLLLVIAGVFVANRLRHLVSTQDAAGLRP